MTHSEAAAAAAAAAAELVALLFLLVSQLRGGMVNLKDGSGALSVTSPDLYAKRMLSYMESKTLKPQTRNRRTSMVQGKGAHSR
eukprot:SAG22_NODE_1765_length_3624_cov_2.026667_3_plen_84_part_00